MYGQAPPPYPQGQYPQGQYPQGQYPQPTTPGTPPPPAPVPPVTDQPPVTQDPINQLELGFLRGRAQALLTELVAALPGAQQQRVTGIPLVVDDTVGEVNAFAACTKTGKAAMAISDGLLEVMATLAQTEATDQLFGTRLTDAYIALLAQHQRPGAPIVRPAAGFFNPAQQVDARKVTRQHQLFDEEAGFVLGHELAHHYLGHLPCTAGNTIGLGEIGALLSQAVPLFNQPNEIAADVGGVNNLLATGARRADYHLTEGGGLLTMRFFGGLDQLTPATILFGFERSHPPPALRTPIIQQTANTWRLTGGRSGTLGF